MAQDKLQGRNNWQGAAEKNGKTAEQNLVEETRISKYKLLCSGTSHKFKTFIRNSRAFSGNSFTNL